ncbi:MAG: glucosaminidase domain-containing protein [Idiomarina sp.]|nr:glucosaminidase domain-containing protein [Idiomarina sp.]
MKWMIRSLTAIAVAAALAVPFVQQSGSDDVAKVKQVKDNARQVSWRGGRDQLRLPVIEQPLSQSTQYVPDFADIYDINERKKAFFAYLLPAIEEMNDRVMIQREELYRLQAKRLVGGKLLAAEQDWLNELVQYYRVDEEQPEEQFAVLMRRVDIVPSTLVLIQAANESGWGTSRFARDGLNFFGQWCWTEGCGIVPASRPAGQSYEVRSFASMEESVEAFIRNLNTHFAYKELREMRLQEREDDDTVSSGTMTAGLMSYSERGQDYIDELNQMIRINRPIIDEVRETYVVDISL